MKWLCVALYLFHVPVVWAWGGQGHQVVAYIAEHNLTERSRIEIGKLLDLEKITSLGDVASWADQVRGKEPGLVSHAVRIPFDASGYDEARDCKSRSKCVIAGIINSEEILRSNNAEPFARLKALKLLVHYVGDIHQPLHAIQETGGMPVQIGAKQYKLHKVWDTIIISRLNLSPQSLADKLCRRNLYVEQGDPVSWAWSSHEIARKYIYGGDESVADTARVMHVKDHYLEKSAPIVEDQLLKAGVRLGRVLNEIFDQGHSISTK